MIEIQLNEKKFDRFNFDDLEQWMDREKTEEEETMISLNL